MLTTFIGLLPLIVAAAVLPLEVAITLFWLRDRNGLPRATGFVSGRAFVQLCQGLLVGYGLKAADDAVGRRGAERIASALLVIVGVVWLLLVAVTCFRRSPASDFAPRWMAALRGVSALTAFGIGGLIMAISVKQWVFFFSAIAMIDNADLDRTATVLLYLCFVVASQALILAPLFVALIAPASATRVLTALQAWLARNKRAVTVALSLVFGVWFVWKGIAGLRADTHEPFPSITAASE
jgi:hypothetical protein